LEKPFIAARPPPRSSPSVAYAWLGRCQPAARLHHLKGSGEARAARPSSAQPSGLTLRLQQGEDIAFANRPLHVADDGAAGVVHELHTHLQALPLGAGPAQHLGHL
ncbi:hypothetical protein N301_14584, partial [Charadrius vociferus]